jgi:uncharacterized protein YvpB
MRKAKRFAVFMLAIVCTLAEPGVPASSKAGDSHTISGFPVIYQMPELPTGCEVTALTMAMHYYGYNVGKTTMAGRYLPIASPDFYYGSNGRLYGPDMDNYFVGDPFTEWGYICGAPALCTAADRYFKANKVRMRAKDLTGSSPSELYSLVEQDIPVVVLVTIGMVNRYPYFSWYSPSGKPMSISHDDHGAVLIGYTPTTVTLADPLAGRVTYSRYQFESVFKSRGLQCVILEEAVYKSGYTDVPDGQWCTDSVVYCRDNGLMSGTGDKQFSPGGTMTRSMLASVLHRVAGEPEAAVQNPFTDVRPGQWYAQSVVWAYEAGVMEGYGDGRFGAKDPVTREQVIATLWRYEGEPEAPAAPDFDDEGDISEYAAAAVDWARDKGIISGKSGNLFDPGSSMTRAEIAVVLKNYMEQRVESNAGL